MKFKLMGACALLSVYAAACSMPAKADDKKDISAMYAKLSAAFKAKDTTAIANLCTKDFTMTQVGGKPQPGPVVMGGLQQWFGMIKTYESNDIKMGKMSITGKTAKVSTTMTDVTIIATGKGKTGKLKQVNTGTDVLEKSAAGWKVKSVVNTDDKKTLDGKPIDDVKLMSLLAPPPAKK